MALLGQHRRQIRAAAEPALRGRQEPRVHVHGRHARAARMHDQADAGRDVVELLAVARQRLRHLRRQPAVGRRGVDADLFEQPAAAEKAAGAAAAAGGALPGLVGEHCGLAGKQIGRRFALQRLDLGADPVAQRFEPDFCFGAPRFGEARRVVADGVGVGHLDRSIGMIQCAEADRAAPAARTDRSPRPHDPRSGAFASSAALPHRAAASPQPLRPKTGFRPIAPTGAKFAAPAPIRFPAETSMRASTVSLRLVETTARREIESRPPRSSSRPISAYSARAA